MFSAADVANALEMTPRAIEDIKSLDSLPEETMIAPVTPRQRRLLAHPFIKPHSHARDHIPYFTDEMCDVADGVFDALSALSEESVSDIEKIRASIEKRVYGVKKIVLEPKAWKGGRYLLQLKLRLRDAVPSRSVALPPSWADRVFLHRRHSKTGGASVHFVITESATSWESFVSETDTLIIQMWLGTSTLPIEAGTMYASGRFPDEPDPSSTNNGILFKMYRDEKERNLDAEAFIHGMRSKSVACLIDPTVYQKMVLASGINA